MRTTKALSWTCLAVVALAASCAQGSSDTSGLGGTLPTSGSDAGSVEGGGSGDPVGDDAGGGTNPDDAGGGAGGEDAGGAEDAGTSGEDAGTPGPDAGTGIDSGGGTGGTDAGSVVPTTCAQADMSYGCCVGNELYYCASGSSTITKKACSGGEVCGWDSSKTYYYCVASPGAADPSGTYPMGCE